MRLKLSSSPKLSFRHNRNEVFCGFFKLSVPPASVRGSSYRWGRNGINYFSKYPFWQSIDQRGREHFDACSPEWAAVSLRTFSMLPPLFTSIYYCWTGFFLSPGVLKCSDRRFLSFLQSCILLFSVFPHNLLLLLFVQRPFIIFKILHVKQKDDSFFIYPVVHVAFWILCWCFLCQWFFFYLSGTFW